MKMPVTKFLNNEEADYFFSKYISLDCENRLNVLQEFLHKNGVRTSVIPLDGKKHLYVNFPSSSYNPVFKIKTVISHYDRVENSPGANDNSAANFFIALWAIELAKNPLKIHNVRIFFTDGEELASDGVFSQGAFKLAELFKKLGITNDDVYVFDACGRGNVAVLSNSGVNSKSSGNFKKKFMDLFERTQNILRESCTNSWMTLPTPYSDNAGFLASGIPAVAITLLPREEAALYYKNLMADRNLEKIVTNSEFLTNSKSKIDRDIAMLKFKEKIPLTWRMFHTDLDNHRNLTSESLTVMMKILENIANLKVGSC